MQVIAAVDRTAAAASVTGETVRQIEAVSASPTNNEHALSTADRNGEAGGQYVTGTTLVSGLAARHVQCLTDTVFTSLTNSAMTGSFPTGVLIPAGTLIVGRITALQLTSGAVAIYN